MPQTATATAKPDPKAAPAKLEPERAVEIDPGAVKVNTEGFQYRTIVVSMPEGSVADDLRTPAVWRRVQLSPQSALREDDELRIYSHDKSQVTTALVNYASNTEARLTILGTRTFRERQGHYSDGHLEVFWDGSAFGVRRVADQVRVLREGYTTEALAIAALQRSYPTKV